jgi:hypothetical protein
MKRDKVFKNQFFVSYSEKEAWLEKAEEKYGKITINGSSDEENIHI